MTAADRRRRRQQADAEDAVPFAHASRDQAMAEVVRVADERALAAADADSGSPRSDHTAAPHTITGASVAYSRQKSDTGGRKVVRTVNTPRMKADHRRPAVPHENAGRAGS